MIAAMSSATAGAIGLVLLAGAFVTGLLVGPKWWHWGSFVVLTLVLFIPLMMAFFIPLPIVIILNVAISHSMWLKKQNSRPVGGITPSR
ncbi:MAG: hypothetical protein ABSD97_12025 [Acidimicrobiales bacterium]|jgi:hypothetical protein